LLATLRSVPGNVFLPQFPGYLSRAGKTPVAHAVAVCDLAVLRPELLRTIAGQLAGGHFASAVLWPTGQPFPEGCSPGPLDAWFRRTGDIPSGGDFFQHSHLTKLGGLFRYVGSAHARL